MHKLINSSVIARASVIFLLGGWGSLGQATGDGYSEPNGDAADNGQDKEQAEQMENQNGEMDSQDDQQPVQEDNEQKDERTGPGDEDGKLGPELNGFGKSKVIIEINATDGDVGFHALVDGDAWTVAHLYTPDPEHNKLFAADTRNALAEQGLTENFFESAEPLCQADEEEPDARIVTLAEFLERFPAGEYAFTGTGIEGDWLVGGADLTYNLPAAPDITSFDGYQVTWMAGTDLGACSDQSLVDDGTIPDPATVDVVGWEVVVEPADDEVVDPLRVFSVQLPADALSVTVPPEFINSYFADGVTDYKVEVLAIEESGNQTATEEEFALEAPNGTTEETPSGTPETETTTSGE